MEEQDIEQDLRDLISKSSDSRNCARNMVLEYILQDELLGSELPSCLREVTFSV